MLYTGAYMVPAIRFANAHRDARLGHRRERAHRSLLLRDDLPRHPPRLLASALVPGLKFLGTTASARHRNGSLDLQQPPRFQQAVFSQPWPGSHQIGFGKQIDFWKTRHRASHFPLAPSRRLFAAAQDRPAAKRTIRAAPSRSASRSVDRWNYFARLALRSTLLHRAQPPLRRFSNGSQS